MRVVWLPRRARIISPEIPGTTPHVRHPARPHPYRARGAVHRWPARFLALDPAPLSGVADLGGDDRGGLLAADARRPVAAVGPALAGGGGGDAGAAAGGCRGVFPR